MRKFWEAWAAMVAVILAVFLVSCLSSSQESTQDTPEEKITYTLGAAGGTGTTATYRCYGARGEVYCAGHTVELAANTWTTHVTVPKSSYIEVTVRSPSMESLTCWIGDKSDRHTITKNTSALRAFCTQVADGEW